MPKQIDLAEAQFIGFDHALRGHGIVMLAESMGLKKSEWVKLRDKLSLPQAEKEMVDELFKNK